MRLARRWQHNGSSHLEHSSHISWEVDNLSARPGQDCAENLAKS